MDVKNEVFNMNKSSAFVDEENVTIKNVKLEYLTTKNDKYENEISYFKIKDKNIDQKITPLNKEGYKQPYFRTDKGSYILKVKTKYLKLKELKKDETVSADITFNPYEMDINKGYYVKQLK